MGLTRRRDHGHGQTPPATPPAVVQARLRSWDTVVDGPGDIAARWDAEGRWASYRNRCAFYRRTLDGRVTMRAHGTVLDVTDPREVEGVHRAVAGYARTLAADITAGQCALDRYGDDGGTPANLLQRMELAAGWSPQRLLRAHARFARVYPGPVGVLPPDRLLDVVVMPAVGCPNNRCRFCRLYKGTRYRALSPAEFDAHLHAVVGLFGGALSGREGVFLGSASALSLPQGRLMAVLERVRAHFGPRQRGVAAFCDPEHSPPRTPADYAALRDTGLRHVTMGLETGHPDLRRALNKSPDLGPFRATLAGLGETGIVCGITVLVGVGGEPGIDRHHDATVQTIADLGLSRSDRVFLSPIAGSLPAPQLTAETARLRASLRAQTPATVSPYRLDRYRYYA